LFFAIQAKGAVQAKIQAMSDLDAAQNAIATLRDTPDDQVAIRATIAALKALDKTLSHQLQKRGRRRKGEGALTFRGDKKLYQFEVERPTVPSVFSNIG
jgi:hypothetical protein